MHPNETLFVKNLETIQGDERDVIFISIGYGRNEEGVIFMNFGPLSLEGGHRRLNVLMTRARSRCEIFSNITSTDIRIGENKSEGIVALREFLHYAETGKLGLPTTTNLPTMSPFEDVVIAKLRASGYKVEPQVGTAGFFIDIGVCDPNNPDNYILGIECDGAKYHSARSARDRDRLRQAVLEERGWKIHRIWSTDWWKNSDFEFKRLLTAIESAKQCNNELIKINKPSSQNTNTFVRYESNIHIDKLLITRPYKKAKLSINLDGRELRDIYLEPMAGWVKTVVDIESPVHIDEVILRIREAAGIDRAGSAIKDAIFRGAQYAARNHKMEFEKDFLWKLPRNKPEIRNRADFPSYLKKIEYIHPEEIKMALIEVVETSYGISRDDAIALTLKQLGFDRSHESLCNYVDKQIEKLIKIGNILQNGNQLNINV
jgi:very-short-patch-repair endonuclease